MFLNQNEYTMASLGFSYQKPPLFLPNQTRPPSFPYMFQPTPPTFDYSPLFLSSALAISGGLRRGSAATPPLSWFSLLPLFLSTEPDLPSPKLNFFLCFFHFLRPQAAVNDGEGRVRLVLGHL